MERPSFATAWAELMRRLGYERYGAQGGDWGSAISRELGVVDAEHMVGVHLTPSGPGSRRTKPTPDNEEEQRSLQASQRYQSELSGYGYLQATRPQTLPTPSLTLPSDNWPGSWRSSRTGPTRLTVRKMPSIAIAC